MTTAKSPATKNLNVRVLNDKILFRFFDTTKKGHFVDETKSGIIIDRGGNNHEYSTKYCRIGEVVATGNKAQQFQPGDKIAIQALMWTGKSVMIDGVECWMTETRHVIGTV